MDPSDPMGQCCTNYFKYFNYHWYCHHHYHCHQQQHHLTTIILHCEP